MFHLRKKFKRRIECLQCKAQKLLKQRLDFHFRKELKRLIDCLQCEAKKVFKQRLDFPFDKGIETTDRFVTMQGQKNVETTLRFSI